MRLLRDTSGTFDQAKDPLQRDLITLQRSFDQLQAQLTEQKSALDDVLVQLANPVVTIAASGQVAGLAGAGLKAVAHDQSMFGTGTAVSPLRVNSALFGSPIYAYDHTFSVTDISGMFATPIQAVAGQANSLIVPLFWSLLYTKNNQAWGTGETLQLFWSSSAAGSASTFIPNLALGFNSATVWTRVSVAASNATGLDTFNNGIALGDNLMIRTSASLGAVGTFALTAGMKVRIIYTFITF